MRKLIFLSLLVIVMIVAAACGDGEQASDEEEGEFTPEESIEIVAPAGAGGGWDTTARSAAQVFDEEGIIDQDIGVVNKEGGGGSVAWSYINSQEGSPYNLFVSSPPLIFVPLNGQTELTYEDFTPIANVIADYAAFAVKEDAKWDNLNELFDDMKEDPSSITVVGASSPGSMDHMQFVKIAKEAGVDVTKIKYVSNQEGGALTDLLNGSVDVYSTGVAETVEQVKADKIKVLGVTSPERLEGDVLETFPTAKEQGIDATFVNWRGFFGPPDMDESAISYYEEKFKELSDSEAFADIRSKYGWSEQFIGHKEYKEFLAEQTEELTSLMEELGLAE
ncbi:tripartite tricarboxylate transporter substrate binding protein [Lentibacillus salicampi]|uniref:Tripartite tricarboxylate transporter substrate binding protein n=1 Tax=Lentibacillus salicampi TaxID=175306 RepID=A0A4Y9ABS1_9BACI|nr:tripartite tricarboxylate transporter substrate-binding protein [Lentibacillus salicampi]TFJ93263.1 tripartite tricarboxylate transporter substrate binding protein [Lentibacillus salicampi]